uniref:Uncharacterized protein n=1 Tax=Lygus hesperus TaxID=30085 RepID=A0A146L3L2_LYGHE
MGKCLRQCRSCTPNANIPHSTNATTAALRYFCHTPHYAAQNVYVMEAVCVDHLTPPPLHHQREYALCLAIFTGLVSYHGHPYCKSQSLEQQPCCMCHVLYTGHH